MHRTVFWLTSTFWIAISVNFQQRGDPFNTVRSAGGSSVTTNPISDQHYFGVGGDYEGNASADPYMVSVFVEFQTKVTWKMEIGNLNINFALKLD